jgi:tetratricopeptide (TPR) repeat protein
MMRDMKKAAFMGILVLAGAACVTVAPPPPTLAIESPTPSFSAELSLDERIAVEDAWKLLRQGRVDRAQKKLLELPETNPFRAAGLGYVALVVNNLAAAEQNFLAAAESFPDLPMAYLGLAQVYEATGQPDLVYKNYLEVLKREPENERARTEVEAIRLQKTQEYMAEAESYASLGNAERGKESYLKALEFSPKLQAAHLGIARLYMREKSFPNALFHLQAAFQNEPKNPAVLRDYAEALFLSGQLSRSLDTYAKLLEVAPTDKAAQARSEAIKNKLGVFDLPSQYSAIPSLAAVTREDVAALIAVKFREAFDTTPPRTPVIVDITTSWALRDIVRVAGFDIMEVNSNRTFEPRRTVTRADLADVLVRLVSALRKRGFRIVEQIPVDRIRIADVPPDHFSFPTISQAIAFQLLGLGSDRTFKPDQPVSGVEAVKAFDLLAGLIK